MANKLRRKKPPSDVGDAAKADWDRDQFSARLTSGRKTRLRELAARLPPGLSPVGVVDRAVEIALEAGLAGTDRAVDLSRVEDRIAKIESRFADELRSLRSLVAETADEVRGLSELMSAVVACPDSSASSGSGFDDAAPSAVASLRSWLDARGGAAPTLSAVARWRSKSRLSDRMVAMEFEIATPAAPGPRSIVRVEPLDAASPFAKADAAAALSLECRRDPRGGWSVSARRINEDRTVGEIVGAVKV